MKNKDEIINKLFGLSIDSPSKTPMSKGECKLAMETYLLEYKTKLNKFLLHGDI